MRSISIPAAAGSTPERLGHFLGVVQLQSPNLPSVCPDQSLFSASWLLGGSSSPLGPGTELSPRPTWPVYQGSASQVSRALGNPGISGGPSHLGR